MQRKINHYWKRKETSDETLSSVATKVQRTESNVSRSTHPKVVQSAILYLFIKIKLRKNVPLFIR